MKALSLEEAGKMKIAIISPVRNESQYIEKTLLAVTGQTVTPSEWIIVDDDSTDETASIVARYAADFPWLKLVHRDRRENKGDRQRGKGVVDTFYYGHSHLTDPDYDFVVKLDGDVSFEPDYFESLLRQFAATPRLGIAGGGLYERTDGVNWDLKSAPDHVGGPVKTYRRECFDDIGGLVPALGWDGFDEWKALTLGWQVQSYQELKINHYRIMGNATGPLRAKIEQGYGAHYMGYHFLYTVARGVRHMATQPYIVGGLAMIAAHVIAWIQGRDQLPDSTVKHFIQRTQLRQLAGMLVGKRVYKSQV